MAKKVAVLAVNPVNGFGLFQYLEAFHEHKIPYKVFAAADTPHICTNSGIALQADDVVAHLKGREQEYDAVAFACGDAMPKFAENAGKPYNTDMIEVIKAFGTQGKILIGHCVGGLVLDMAGVTTGKRIALHPLARPAVRNGKATESEFEIDGGLYTAKDENSIWTMMPQLLKALE